MSRKHLVIVGGVAGGATSAARARRISENIDITVFEKGQFISFANCGLPFYVGGKDIPDRSALLLSDAGTFKKKYNVDVKTQHEVLSLNRETSSVRVRDIVANKEFDVKFDALILSPGASAIVPAALPGVKSRNVFVVKTVPDADTIRACLEKVEATKTGPEQPRRAVVVGGGFIGLETAEALKLHGFQTTVVEMLSHLLPPFDEDMAAFVEHHLVDSGVDIVLGDGVKGFATAEADANLAAFVELQSGKKLPCDLVILSIGVRAETALARGAGLQIGELGGMSVDSTMRSVTAKNIFCIGDAVEVPSIQTGKLSKFQLAGPAQHQARVAATNAAIMLDPTARSVSHGQNTDKELHYQGALGTAIVGVLGINAACTGLSEFMCKKLNIAYRVAQVHPLSHVGYYPGSKFLHIKLIAGKDDAKILGAQIVGLEGAGVDKRIDVIATAITGKLTAEDLEMLDLAYAPQFGAANDAVAVAGALVADEWRGEVESISPEDYRTQFIEARVPHTLLDVRPEKTFIARHFGDSLNIPLLELRDRLHEVPTDKLVVTTCRVGLTAHIAARTLMGHGYKVLLLRGGITSAHARVHPDDARHCNIEAHKHLE